MSIYDSTKALFAEAIEVMRDAFIEGKIEKANVIRATLIDVFNNTIDDNERLLERANCPKCRGELVCKEGC